jgi:hypothetical protein
MGGDAGPKRQNYLLDRLPVLTDRTIPVDGSDVLIQLNTVECLPDGRTPTIRELRAASRAAFNGKGRHLVVLIPKGSSRYFETSHYRDFMTGMRALADDMASDTEPRDIRDCVLLFDPPGPIERGS